MFKLPLHLIPLRYKCIPKGTVPIGPNFARSKRVGVNLNGTYISVKLPRHRPYLGSIDEALLLKGEVDIYSPHIYRDYKPIGPWEAGPVIYRAFRFYGPPLTRLPAELIFSMVVYKRKLNKASETLLNPAFFKHALEQRLTGKYGEDKSQWASCWQTPLEWQARHQHEVFAASYKTKRIIGRGTVYQEYAFPITDDCMVLCHIDQSREKNGDLAEQDKYVDITPLETLTWQILNSLEIQLSNTAKAQLSRAQKEYPHATLSKSKAPLKWTTPEEDKERAAYLERAKNYQDFSEGKY